MARPGGRGSSNTTGEENRRQNGSNGFRAEGGDGFARIAPSRASFHCQAKTALGQMARVSRGLLRRQPRHRQADRPLRDWPISTGRPSAAIFAAAGPQHALGAGATEPVRRP